MITSMEDPQVWVPNWIAEQYTKRHELAKLQKDPAYQEAQDKLLADTKPDYIVDKSDPGRVIVIVGMGQLYRNDMKDMVKRTREKPDPRIRMAKGLKQIANDIDTRIFQEKHVNKKSFYMEKTLKGNDQ